MTAAFRFAGRFDSQAAPRASGATGASLALGSMAAAAGLPIPRLLADIAALATGPGAVSLADYRRLRLYDPAFWEGADRRTVVGTGRGRAIARTANFRRDWWALAHDRIASGAYLAAHGLTTVPTLAVYREGLAAPGDRVLRTRDELRAFLAERCDQPLVLRPAEGQTKRLLFTGPRPEPEREADRAIEDVGDQPGVSWLLQPLSPPHPRSPCDAAGEPLAVRLLTLSGAGGALVAGAFWPLGGRREVVASLDPGTGAARVVFAAAEPARARAAPAGLEVPDWARLKAAAVEGARVLGAFGLLAWDIAPGAQGPVILRFDPDPGFELFQLADRQGLLTPDFCAFVDQQRRLKALTRPC